MKMASFLIDDNLNTLTTTILCLAIYYWPQILNGILGHNNKNPDQDWLATTRERRESAKRSDERRVVQLVMLFRGTLNV